MSRKNDDQYLIQGRFPNLMRYIQKQMVKKMDSLDKIEEENYPLIEFFKSLSEEEVKKVVATQMRIFYRLKGNNSTEPYSPFNLKEQLLQRKMMRLRQQHQIQPGKISFTKDIEKMCTNFEHK